MKNKIKVSIICKDVTNYTIDSSRADIYIPSAGDVGIFEVLEIGRHTNIQNAQSLNEHIFEGDQIMAAFGNRYATGQFEGYVPDYPARELDILGKGGCVGLVESSHQKMDRFGITRLRLVGYAVNDSGNVINTKFLNSTTRHLKVTHRASPKKKVILSLGSGMDSGKTTTAAFICRGLMLAGKTVSFIKLTGTVYTKDKQLALNCGAQTSLDFSDYGFPSTFLCDFDELEKLYTNMLADVLDEDPDYVVIEIADGLLQRETEHLINNRDFMKNVIGISYSCRDSLSGVAGINLLAEMGLEPLFISGLITLSPLMVKELSAKTDLPILSIEELASDKIHEVIPGMNPLPVVNNYIKQVVGVQKQKI